MEYGLAIGVIYRSRPITVSEHYLTRRITKGAIAGFIGGAIAFILVVILIDMIGIPYMFHRIHFYPSHISAYALGVMWGSIFGALYAIFFDRIPRTGVMKGLYFGLILWIIANIRPALLMASHWGNHWVIAFTVIGIFIFSSYGLVLGVLYKKK